MFCRKKVKVLWYLGITMLSISAFTSPKIEINADNIVSEQSTHLIIENIERKRTMINETKQAESGQFQGTDKQGSTVLLEWQKTNILAPEFADAMKRVWPFARIDLTFYIF